MKNLIKRAHFALYILLTAGFLTSCEPQPIQNYKGGVVYAKENPPAGKRFVLKIPNPKDTTEMKFKTVYVMEFDFAKYNVGDTVRACR